MDTQKTKQSIVWGSLLILFGVVSLIELYVDLAGWAWVGILAVAGAGCLLVYLIDRSNWPLLIPTYILWVLAGLVGLLLLGWLPDGYLPLFVLTAVSLPFLATYLYDRTQKWALIPAYVMLSIGLMVTLLTYGWLSDLLVPAFVMFAIALPFYAVYLRAPQEKWPLIPAGILTLIGLAFMLATQAAQYVVAILFIMIGSWLLLRQASIQKEAPPKI